MGMSLQIQIYKEISSKLQIYKEIGLLQNITLQICRETGSQKVSFAYNIQIYKEIENLQGQPF